MSALTSTRRAVRAGYARVCAALARRLLSTARSAFAHAGDDHRAEHSLAALTVGQCQSESCSGSLLTLLIPAVEAIALGETERAQAIATRTLIASRVWDLRATAQTPPRTLEFWLRRGRAYIHEGG
jgi:hypothetical protein